MRVRKAPEASPMLQDSPAAKRHNRGNGTAAALMTIRAYYTPETSKAYVTKKAAASAYGVSAPLFTKWEKELQKTPAVMDQIARGEMPTKKTRTPHPHGFNPKSASI